MTEQTDTRPPIPIGDLLNALTDHSQEAIGEARGDVNARFDAALGQLTLTYEPEQTWHDDEEEGDDPGDDEGPQYRSTIYYFALTSTPIVREG